MPILIPFVDPTPDVTQEPMRVIDLVDLDGQVLDIAPDLMQYAILSGIQGFQVPPREVVRDRYPGMAGSNLVQINDLERAVVVPFLVASEDGRSKTTAALVSRLRAMLSHRGVNYVASQGTFDIRVTDVDGVSMRSLRCTYLEGMEGNAGVAAAGEIDWWTFDIKAVAVQPFWVGGEWTTPVVGQSAPYPFLSNEPTGVARPWPRRLRSGLSIGAAMPIEVPGDVPCPPVVELAGGFTTARVTSPAGLDVSIGAVPEGATFRLDLSARPIPTATLNGIPRWDLIGDNPQWSDLQPGATTMTIALMGATAAAAARVHGSARWETAW